MSNALTFKARRAIGASVDYLVGCFLASRVKRLDYKNAFRRRHRLPGELVVSLTSFPPRFPSLHLTLRCLLSQTVQPDRILLWIAETDMPRLPGSVWRLIEDGVEVQPCGDIGSYKKIIPAIKICPTSYIVTADDDVYYGPTWLEELEQGTVPGQNVAVCQRADLIEFNKYGSPLPYARWRRATNPGQIDPHLFPIGIGGVLYPPGIFDARVTDEETFKTLCPNADDIWLYWMTRLNNGQFKALGSRRRFFSWPGTQHVALWRQNLVSAGNDDKLQKMMVQFGWPS